MNNRPQRQETASLYGFHAVREAFLNPARRIHKLYVTDQAIKGFEPTINDAKAAGLKRPAPQITEKRAFDRLVPQGAVHQGLALACDNLEEFDINDLLIRVRDKPGRQVFLILDQVTDPHNVGAILRSACAFGAAGMILQKKHAPALDGVLAKTACGGVEHLPVAYETNLSRTIETLKEHEFFVYGLDERGEKTINTLMRKNGQEDNAKIVLVLGAEGPGMRHLIREHCDVLVRLPTQGSIASLNVSNAAAVALFTVLSP
jgi:23S rRNA (guanosine2251-2'-O)-methyltransferase